MERLTSWPPRFLDGPPFDEGDLGLAFAFTGRINDIEERAVFNRRVAEARVHAGQVHTVTVVTLTPALERALVYRAVAAWAEELPGIMRSVAAAADEGGEPIGDESRPMWRVAAIRG
ncbi:MAG: hypothetical protein IPK12_01280 [Gemmatimonadetes bacterium]|nr:hypothetical protein [Gemmatimonadota bacterium]